MAQRGGARWWIQAIAAAAAVAGCADSHGVGPEDASVPRDAIHTPADVGPLPHDASWVPVDGGAPPPGCEAQDARPLVCPDALCDGPGTWHWNGDTCFFTDCGACEGSDCAVGWPSEEACRADHDTCDATLCRATGGEWWWWPAGCGHLACGHAPLIDCFTPVPLCACGPQQIFEEGVGCVDDPYCAEPPPASRAELCTSTGGSWGPYCCDAVCGVHCDLDCAAMACDCGEGRVMDDARGCIETVRCHERLRGESCAGPIESVRCEEGTICCDRCGGAGCSGRPVCAAPVCDSDPLVDVCGNRRDAA